MAAATAAVVKFDVTSNSRSSRKDLEREAVDSFRELERAERAAGIPELGKRFGKAMADLNENLEHGEWMKTLERLGITYRKAQYWMHIYKGKTPTRAGDRNISVVICRRDITTPSKRYCRSLHVVIRDTDQKSAICDM